MGGNILRNGLCIALAAGSFAAAEVGSIIHTSYQITADRGAELILKDTKFVKPSIRTKQQQMDMDYGFREARIVTDQGFGPSQLIPAVMAYALSGALAAGALLAYRKKED